MSDSDLFSTDRARLRAAFRDAWRKDQEALPLEPLEAVVAAVVARHPEYQALIESAEAVTRDFLPELGEANPFLHMALHLAVQDQLAMDRPAGVRQAYDSLTRRLGDAHDAEHAMMECLGAALWEAQRSAHPPDEASYLACLKRLTGAG
jgi:hypothetical protein